MRRASITQSEPTVVPVGRGALRPATWLAAALLVLAAFAAYANTLRAPFVFDDLPGIVDNRSIRDWSAPGRVLLPPGSAAGAGARPVVNFSLALNYAIGGTDVFGYHLFNLALHACTGLVLLGILRRTFRTPLMARFLARGAADGAALAAALLWVLHPLATESVTCVIQRSEVLGALFYLLTIYGYIRAAEGVGRGWAVAATTACVLGMASKEFVSTAPLVAWLYDRTFLSGSLREAWRRRRGLLLALATTWIVLAALVVAGGQRGGTVGFGLGMSSWSYALTQCRAVVRYLWLAVWPHPLVLDYGNAVVAGVSAVWGQALLLGCLIVAIVVGCRRGSPAAFAGAAFLAVLAPSSSIVPLVTQTMAEHRMYLPLAAVIATVVVASQWLIGRAGNVFVALAAAALAFTTIARNGQFRSVEGIWRDTVVKAPANPRAHTSLGIALDAQHRTDEAMAEYRVALKVNPLHPEALTNLGEVITRLGRPTEGLPYLEAAVKVNPFRAESQLNLAVALDRLGRNDEAIAGYRAALALKPELAAAHDALGSALLRRHERSAAFGEFDTALRLDPNDASVHYHLAVAFAETNEFAAAQAHFDRAVALDPTDPVARVAWANALLPAGRTTEAIAQYEAALKIRPSFADAHYNLANVLAGSGRFAEAVEHYRAALQSEPDSAHTENNLGNALTMLGRDADAVPHYERALALNAANVSAHKNLGLAFARLGRMRDAATQFAAAVQLAPNDPEARENLARARAELGTAPP